MAEKIACIGNLTKDYLFNVTELPRLDDVAYVHKKINCLGGRGGVVALALGSLSSEVELITVLPDTMDTHQDLAFLRSHGVGTNGVTIDPRACVPHEVYVAISEEECNCISFFKPGDVHFSASEVQKQEAAEAGIAYFSTHKRAFNLEVVEAIDPCKTRIVHNVSGYLASDRIYRERMLSKSAQLICNSDEAATLCDLERVREVDELFTAQRTVDSIIVTKGEEGAILYDKNSPPQQFAIRPCEVKAPVGAGDSFAAGILFGESLGWPSIRSIPFAVELAAISVSSETSYPDPLRVAALRKWYE